jgi:hypothetical protein
LREVEIHVSEATNGEMAMSFPIFFYTHFWKRGYTGSCRITFTYPRKEWKKLKLKLN